MIIEQSVEYNAPLYLTFIDFEKAFDAIKRNHIWSSLRARGVPDKLVNIITNSYNGITSQVLHEGQLSEPFHTCSGVRQGCSLLPLLFIAALDVILAAANINPSGIEWGFRRKLDDLEYADDIVLFSHRYNDMQSKISTIVSESAKAGLKVNVGKTKVMRINTNNDSAFTINGTALEDVEKFEYLGSVLTTDGGAAADVENRMRKAKNVYGSLMKVWKARTISTQTKMKIFNACVKSVLLYGSETWLVTEAISTKLQTFINRCLRRLLGIWWPNTIRNEELWRICGLTKLELEIRKRKYQWLGHTLRKTVDDAAHFALEWNPQGRRLRGRPKQTWRRTVMQETRKSFGQLRAIAHDRDLWKLYVNNLCNI